MKSQKNLQLVKHFVFLFSEIFLQFFHRIKMQLQQRPLRVKIFYGSAWGYVQRYEDLASLLKRSLIGNGCRPENIIISGEKVPRKAAFEIYFNEARVHSKVSLYLFPWKCAIKLRTKVRHFTIFSWNNMYCLEFTISD